MERPVRRPMAQPRAASAARDFDSFFQAEYPAVVRLGAALTGSVDAAEDLAQDAFLAANLRWERISGYDDPAGWVRRAVVNRAVSRVRKLSSESRALLRLGRSGAVEQPPVRDDVWQAVRRLPRRQAQVLVLVVLDGQPIAGVAAILGCGEATVRTHLGRARARLARELTRSDL